MNQLEFNRAMSYIDDDIVDGFLENKNKLQNKIKFQRKSPQFLKWGAVAATFCLVFSVAWIFAGNANQKPNVPDDIVLGNVTENTTSEHIEANTQHIEDTTDVNIENTTQNIELPTEDLTTNPTVDDFELPAPIDEIVWMKDNNSGATDEAMGKTINGMYISYELMNELETCDNDRYIAVVIGYYNSDLLYNYVYEGESYTELKSKETYLRDLIYKYDRLLKQDGEYFIKYGGLAGDKPSTEYYDKMVSYYGEEILEQFFEDGVFLSEKLEESMIQIKNLYAENVIKLYYLEMSCYESWFPIIIDSFKGYPVISKNNKVFLFVTSSELEKLLTNVDIENIENFHMSLASRKLYEQDDNIYQPSIKDNVTGFTCEKIVFKSDYYAGLFDYYPQNDESFIKMFNDKIRWYGITNEDCVKFTFYYEGSLVEEDFNGMNYVDIIQYESTSKVVITVKVADINLEKLKKLSQKPEITNIDIRIVESLIAFPE